MNSLSSLLKATAGLGQLLPASRHHLEILASQVDLTPWEKESLEELLTAGEWTEINDRFFKTLTFGTGGIRGRTQGKILTQAEQGKRQAFDSPEHAAVGSNMMNMRNVCRATGGLARYLLRQFPNEPLRVVLSHDTRHFSRAFALKAAEVLARYGITPYLFAQERSTPQLSFSVRWLQAHAGIMMTASHNPFHDNGLKAYFADGGQLVEPHASKVIAEVEKNTPLPTPSPNAPTPIILDTKADEAYLDAVSELVLEPQVIQEVAHQLKIIYTPLHGTGIHSIPPLLDRFGFQYSLVEAQISPDGRFPTVPSPNPENSEALQMALAQAQKENADLVIATDPDDDRMGVAVRNEAGEMILLTGNQIGSLLAYYRCERLVAQGILHEANLKNAALIKTIVTTDLQKNIADHFGIKCVDTLTGFKYIGEKMGDYEKQASLPPQNLLPLAQRRNAQLAQSTYVIFAGEESYGYSGGDYVRDKDANAACLMFAEVVAWAKSQGQTALDYLHALYEKLGFFTEKLGTLTFEGAAGAEKIQTLLASYQKTPPREMGGSAVKKIDHYATTTFHDVDGKPLPREKVLMFHLANGNRMAIRASGTEPKVKFYFFGQAPVQKNLSETQQKTTQQLDQWWEEIQTDIRHRITS